MNAKEIRRITRERFAGWTDKYAESHATPVLSVGVGHDHMSGTVVMTVVDADWMAEAEIKLFLLEALRLLG